jgi:hypothetical protein
MGIRLRGLLGPWLCALCVVLGCTSGELPAAGWVVADAGGASDASVPEDAGTTGSNTDAGTCTAAAHGQPCATAQDCCSGLCDPGTNLCTPSLSCKAVAEACLDSGECCSHRCVAGLCEGPFLPCPGSAQCQATGGCCTHDPDCCAGLVCTAAGGQAPCDGGVDCTCQSSWCAGAGQACDAAGDCCGDLQCRQDAQPQIACDGSGPCRCHVVFE